LPKRLQPYMRGLRKWLVRPPKLTEPFRSVFHYTQAHPIRQENLLRLAYEIEANRVPGAVVECGVLDGGTAALIAYGTAASRRAVHLFDSWEGLPTNTEKDGDASMWAGQVVGSARRVVKVFKSLNIDSRRVTFHRGWFNLTFPNAK